MFDCADVCYLIILILISWSNGLAKLGLHREYSRIEENLSEFSSFFGHGEAYKEYFEVEELGCPHLSALHFPMGGAFSYMHGDIFSLNACVLKSLEYGETDCNKTLFFKKLYNSKYGISFSLIC